VASLSPCTFLKCLDDLPPAVTGEFVGIAAYVSVPERNQLHCGVLYGGAASAIPRFIDLAWHVTLRDNDVTWLRANPDSAQMQWARVDLPPERARPLSALCRLIARTHANDLPYAVLYDGGRFLADGTLLLGERGYGLTCATFVLLPAGIPNGLQTGACLRWGPFRAVGGSLSER
jgi:hypothetical protein